MTGFMDTMKMLEGKTVATVESRPDTDEDGDPIDNGVIITCTDGTQISMYLLCHGWNYEDTDIIAEVGV